MRLVSKSEHKNAEQILCDLRKERKEKANFSDRSTPTLEEHCAFVESGPYMACYLIDIDFLSAKWPMRGIVGAIHLTKQREIGIVILKQYRRRGMAQLAIKLLMHRHPGNFLANVSPNNYPSIKFFEKLGFKLIQNTFALESNNGRLI